MFWDRKVVWVTGASSGIGEALARALADRGAELVLSARREAKLQKAASECANPERHRVLPLDLAEPEMLEEAARRALGFHGHLDVVIHNAGISQRALAKDTDLAVVRRLLEVNFFGTVALTRVVLPSMLARRSGHLVAVTSLVGKIGTPLRSAYAASKHALHGYFDSLRAEVWRDNVKVTLVCPGFIRTELPLHALTGDGTPQGKMDEAQLKGYPAPRCAAKILAAVEKGKTEVLIGGKEKYAVTLKRFLPGVFNRLIRTAKVT